MERVTGWGALQEKGIPFLSTVWRHSRKWAIPIPKGTRELLDPNQLYKITIEFTKPPDNRLNKFLEYQLSKLSFERYVEVTKVWKSGKRRLFPITKNTALRLVPKLQELREATDLIIEEATIQDAIDYLIRDDPRYKELKRKILNPSGRLWYNMTEKDRKQQEKYREELNKLREEYRDRAKELIEEGFKPGRDVELLKEWIKNPLLITAVPYEAKSEREAIALYKRAPIPLKEDDIF